MIDVTDLAAKVTPYLFIDELHGSAIGTIVGRGVSRETDFPSEEFKALPVSYTHLTLPTKRIV